MARVTDRRIVGCRSTSNMGGELAFYEDQALVSCCRRWMMSAEISAGEKIQHLESAPSDIDAISLVSSAVISPAECDLPFWPPKRSENDGV